MLTIDLARTVALVIGGSRGIGAGITAALAQAGATTIFTHTGNPQYAERCAATLGDWQRRGLPVEGRVADAREADQTQAVVQYALEKHGRLDTLVVNAGRNTARAAEDTPVAAWHESMEINLSPAFYAVRAALPAMIRQKHGRIMLVGSSAAFDGGGGAIDYAAAKAALVGMMRYLTRTYARRGVLTNVLHPAVIDTDLVRERYDNDEKLGKLLAQVPVGRLGRPEDIGGLAAFLASSWGDFICGQEFLIDGGRTFYRHG
jgi:NAD(P)-dependent dehydrogenase (short-subunit alcohol dehydrogenase family)